MDHKEHAVAMARAWLQRHREQLQDQLDGLKNQLPPFTPHVEVIAPTPTAEEIVGHWIKGIDEVLEELDDAFRV